MSGGRLRFWAISGVWSLALVCAGVAGQQGQAGAEYTAEYAGVAGATRVPLLEAKISDQDAALRDSIKEISAVGDELDWAQARAEDARARAGDLRRQTRRLKRQIAEQDASFREAQARYRAQA